MKYITLFDDKTFYELMISMHNIPHLVKKLELNDLLLDNVKFDRNAKKYVYKKENTYFELLRKGDVLELGEQLDASEVNARELNHQKNSKKFLYANRANSFECGIDKIEQSVMNEYVFENVRYLVNKNKLVLNNDIINFKTPIQSLIVCDKYIYLSVVGEYKTNAQILCYDQSTTNIEWVMNSELNEINFEKLHIR